MEKLTMKKCLREQKRKGKNKLDAKNFCRTKLGFSQKLNRKKISANVYK